MKEDNQGLVVSTTSEDAINTINHFNQQLISNGKHLDTILQAADNHQDCFLILCFAAVFNLFMQEIENNKTAKKLLDEADRLKKQANPREKLYFEAFKAWHQFDYQYAIDCLVNITQQWPKDVCAAKLAEWLFFCTGQKHQGKNFMHMCDAMHADNQDNNHFLASYAFALELAGNYEKAKKTGYRALEIDADTAWAHHAISHVQLLSGEIQDSIKFMEQHSLSWHKVAPPLSCHNFWHLSLLYLADFEFNKALSVLKNNIWLDFPNAGWQQIEASSLLWRLEMAGQRQDDQWQKICQHLGKHPMQHDVPFNNIHFVYALARNYQTDQANEAIIKISKDIQRLPQSQQHTWHAIALPLLKGVVAFANEDFKQANSQLAKAMQDIYAIGGSDAQCEIAIQTYYLSLLKSGEKERAKNVYQKYLSHYDNTSLAEYWASI